MTPQEKAKELFDLFDKIPRYAKRAVDEIINALNDTQSTLGLYENGVAVTDKSFWQEVKQELENL